MASLGFDGSQQIQQQVKDRVNAAIQSIPKPD
jgi:hypothetical protein